MGFRLDIGQLKYSLRKNRAFQILLLAFAGFIIFLVVVELKHWATEGQCPECKKYHVFREVSAVKTGTESGYEDEWDYKENKWVRVYKTTTSYLSTFRCSNCEYTSTFPTYSTSTRK